jgi:hypothetical protein
MIVSERTVKLDWAVARDPTLPHQLAESRESVELWDALARTDQCSLTTERLLDELVARLNGPVCALLKMLTENGRDEEANEVQRRSSRLLEAVERRSNAPDEVIDDIPVLWKRALNRSGELLTYFEDLSHELFGCWKRSTTNSAPLKYPRSVTSFKLLRHVASGRELPPSGQAFSCRALFRNSERR